MAAVTSQAVRNAGSCVQCGQWVHPTARNFVFGDIYCAECVREGTFLDREENPGNHLGSFWFATPEEWIDGYWKKGKVVFVNASFTPEEIAAFDPLMYPAWHGALAVARDRGLTPKPEPVSDPVGRMIAVLKENNTLLKKLLS